MRITRTRVNASSLSLLYVGPASSRHVNTCLSSGTPRSLRMSRAMTTSDAEFGPLADRRNGSRAPPANCQTDPRDGLHDHGCTLAHVNAELTFRHHARAGHWLERPHRIRGRDLFRGAW